MSALGGLMILLVYGTLGMLTVVSLLIAYLKRREGRGQAKRITVALIALAALIVFAVFQRSNNAKAEMDNVGTYYLSHYPKCGSCKVVLHDDNRFEVLDSTTVLEKGRWHYKNGGDYWIVYLNSEEHQLGSGNYAYERYEQKNPDK